MSYVVNWHRADGQPGWHPVADVQEATTYVEHLRNAEGVETTRIYRLEEVAFEFRPYYRVELADAAHPSASPLPVVEPASMAPVEGETHNGVEPDGDDAIAGSARRGLFGR